MNTLGVNVSYEETPRKSPSCRYQATGDNVWVVVEESPPKSEGGIILTGGAIKTPPLGRVVSIGKSVKEVSVDDLVYFNGQSSKFTIGDNYNVVKEAAILAIVEE